LGQITVLFRKGEREIEVRFQGGVRLEFREFWLPQTNFAEAQN
jgi:hypothetical protein